MKPVFVASLLSLSVVGAGSLAHAGEWAIDSSHSAAHFSVRHMMVSDVRGTFEKVTGTVNLDDKEPSKSEVDVKIDVASLETRDDKRDEHLKSPDFFDAANHPQITFKSTQIKKAGKDKYKVTGDLTMKGVTKPVTLDVVGPSQPVKSPWG
jgi:polyisoprenoid-binding protein YceI